MFQYMDTVINQGPAFTLITYTIHINIYLKSNKTT